jgi:4'-phosphopantetheinyl transferase
VHVRDALLPGECQVWWARPADACPPLHVLLSADERQRLAGIRQAEDRDRFLVGCAISRLVLAAYLGQAPADVAVDRACAWCGAPHGKPRLLRTPSPSVEWSVSHSGERVVVGFALGMPVGLDTERLSPDLPIDQMASDVLTPRELGVLQALPAEWRIAAFVTYWARKEAVTKATGHGLTIPPNSFEVSEPDAAPRLLSAPWDPSLTERISMHDLNHGADSITSLAVIGDCQRVLTRDGSALIRQWCAR